MPIIHDDEFGPVTVRRVKQSRHMRMSVAPNGTIRVSVPTLTPMFMIKRLVDKSRKDIRQLRDKSSSLLIQNGMEIGKQHSILIREHDSLKTIKVVRQKNLILVTIPRGMNPNLIAVRDAARPVIIQCLKKEAKMYLTKRIQHLSAEFGYDYASVRFSHASTRWGSCSSKKVISLNVALMMLPYDLIDYVLIHELAHTKQMNHSAAFWELVEAADPSYEKHRAVMKTHSPYV